MRKYFFNTANKAVRIVNTGKPDDFCHYVNFGDKKVRRSKANTNDGVLRTHRLWKGTGKQYLYEICVNQFRKYFKFDTIPTIWWGE